MYPQEVVGQDISVFIFYFLMFIDCPRDGLTKSSKVVPPKCSPGTTCQPACYNFFQEGLFQEAYNYGI